MMPSPIPVQHLSLLEQATSRWIAGATKRHPFTLAIATAVVLIGNLLGGTVDRRVYVVMGIWFVEGVLVGPWCAKPFLFAERLRRYALTLALDVVLLGLVYYYLDAAQFLGIGFFALMVVAASAVLPRQEALGIGVLAIVVYAILVAGEVTGVQHVRSPLGLAPVTGNQSFMIVSIIAAAAIVLLLLRTHEHVLFAMRDAETRHQAVVRTAADAIIIFDTEGKIIEVNPAVLSHTGYSWDELKTLPNSSLFLDEDWPTALDAFERTVRGESCWIEARIVLKNGEARWAEIWTSSIAIDARPGVVVVARDVSVRKKQSEQLRQNDAKLDLVLKTLNSGFYPIDRDQLITSVRGKGSDAGSSGGISRLVGKPVSTIAPSPDQAMLQRDQHQKALEGEEVTWVWPVGSGAWVRSHVAPLKDGEGKVIGAAGFWRDETAIMRAREEDDSRWNRFRTSAPYRASDPAVGRTDPIE